MDLVGVISLSIASDKMIYILHDKCLLHKALEAHSSIFSDDSNMLEESGSILRSLYDSIFLPSDYRTRQVQPRPVCQL
jgi:hypothetical protein